MGGAQQPDAAVRGRGEPVPVVLVGSQALPGLGSFRALTGTALRTALVVAPMLAARGVAAGAAPR
jgi:hypothetical protein